MSVKSCVRHCKTYSDFFEVSIGLRQGEVMSPILFSLFVEDLELFLQRSVDCGLTVYDITLILLSFADDMVILGSSQQDLQNSLNLLYEYCHKWGLTVNTDKTKVLIFRKRGRVDNRLVFTYNDNQLDIVDNFNYLGVVFNYTGTFLLNQQHLSGKGLKAMYTLLCNVRNIDFTPKTLCQLFDSFVGSILCYSCEVWGFSKSKEIERIHLKYCKQILGVKLSTSNAGVYGELARYPLYICRFVRIIKYWFKLLHTDNIILRNVYTLSLNDCYNGCSNWTSRVKLLLYEFGFGDIWINPYSVIPVRFITAFKQRLVDNFVQKWKSDLDANSVLVAYKYIKNEFLYEEYLDIVQNKNLRRYLTKLRLSSHNLKIETGRYGRNRIERNQRYCDFCNTTDIEDEYHFVCVCPAYSDLRYKHIEIYYYNPRSMYNFCNLLQTREKSHLVNFAKFLYEAFERRKTLSI